MKKIIVQANANIALIKYWGKRDIHFFLPTKSSLSVTLDGLQTKTAITFNDKKDLIFCNGENSSQDFEKKTIQFLNLFRKQYNVKQFFKIDTQNLFPTAAGLASSASGFASLAFGVSKICDLNLSKKELSILARQGSGSASRSIFGGFAIWHKGEKSDGSDSFAQQVCAQNYWTEFRILVVVVDAKKKKISSREAMQKTIETSRFYNTWIKESEQKIPEIINAIKERSIKKLGMIAENDCLGMHKAINYSIPTIDYLKDSSHKIINIVKGLRKKNVNCYFTIDAGPNVKILCLEKDIEKIESKLGKGQGIKKTIRCKIGSGVKVLN
jgi:diphosphomevalonate decarboxylase